MQVALFLGLLIGDYYWEGPVASAAPANVVYVRDYARGDCGGDDTAAIQAATSVWLNNQRTNVGGILDFGTGCYLLSSTWRIAQPDGKPVFGEIRGDGANLAMIRAINGIGRAIETDDWWNGQFSGITLQGAGYGNKGAEGNNDDGIVLAAREGRLGTCCGTFHDLGVQGFRRCFALGDDAAPFGQAAEMVLSQVTTQYCGIGFYATGYNSLDFTLIQPHMVFDGVGLYSSTAYQISVEGGSSTGNTVDFQFLGPGNFSVNNFRSETRRDPNVPLVQIGGTTGQRVMISNSTFEATDQRAPVAMTINGGPSLVTLESNFFNGKVVMQSQAGSLIAHHNGIRADNNQPFDIANSSWLDQAANFKPQEPTWWGEWFGEWWPFSTGFVGAAAATATPTPVPVVNTPTPTPLPPTATPVPTVGTSTWVSPQIASADSTVGGDASCAWRNGCYWSTYWGDITLSAKFGSPQTFSAFRFTGNNAGAPQAQATFSLSSSADGSTWLPVTTAAVDFTQTWQTWTLPPFNRVTAQYVRLRIQAQGVAITAAQLLEP